MVTIAGGERKGCDMRRLVGGIGCVGEVAVVDVLRGDARADGDCGAVKQKCSCSGKGRDCNRLKRISFGIGFESLRAASRERCRAELKAVASVLAPNCNWPIVIWDAALISIRLLVWIGDD